MHPLQLFPGLDSRLERRCCLLKDAVAFVGGCWSLKTSADLVSSLTRQGWVNTASLRVLLTQRPRLHDCQGPCIVIIHGFALKCLGPGVLQRLLNWWNNPQLRHAILVNSFWNAMAAQGCCTSTQARHRMLRTPVWPSSIQPSPAELDGSQADKQDSANQECLGQSRKSTCHQVTIATNVSFPT